MLTRRLFLSAALALGLSSAFAVMPARAQGEAEARDFIQTLASEALEAVVAPVPVPQKINHFRQLFIKGFDLPEVSRFVLGRYWRGSTPEQQQEFLSLFSEMTVLTWARRFMDYADQAGGTSIQVTNTTPDGEHGMLVETRVLRPGGQPPILATWRLRSTSGQWQVVDIVVEGVSMAITYRSEYSSVLRAQGGTMDGLLDVMRRRVAQMQAEYGL
ncbi:phospholipid-binding protein MlaC [Telmatospirillum sp. J64-1]|uniref:MlaC/ttg2D family ABC transporter substrate-binding protein n=1 Tax=Telmatospirillum sp. J64-1 TaxID=2502183 RepID=UPI00115E1F3B|nr:ABC transporter substrate-binding protein [Telmatospirillum sp. J64-1]